MRWLTTAFARRIRLRTRASVVPFHRPRPKSGSIAPAPPRADPEPASQRPWWKWRLVLGWASGLAVVALLTMTLLRPQEPVIQLALLDPVGAVRGGGTDALAALQTGWPEAKATAFRTADEIAARPGCDEKWRSAEARKRVRERGNAAVKPVADLLSIVW